MGKKILEIVIFIVIAILLQLVMKYELLSLEALVISVFALVFAKIMAQEILKNE